MWTTVQERSREPRRNFGALFPERVHVAYRWIRSRAPWVAAGALAIGVLGNNVDRWLLATLGWLGEERLVTHWEELLALAALVLMVLWGNTTIVRTRERDAARTAEREAKNQVRIGTAIDRLEQRNAQMVEEYVERIADRMSVLASRWAARTPPDWDLVAEKFISLQARQRKLFVWIEQLPMLISAPISSSRADAYEAWEGWLGDVLLDLGDLFGLADNGRSVIADTAVMLPLEDGEWLRMARGSWVSAESIETGLFRKYTPAVSLAECGLTGAAFGDRRMVHIVGVHESEYHMPMRCRGCFHQEIMAIPIGSENPPLGVLSVSSIQPDTAFDENTDVYILAAYAGVVAYGLRYMQRLGVSPAELLHAAPLATI